MLSSSVTHEMVTPLKAMINLCQDFYNDLEDGDPNASAIKLVIVTARLMLA
jgi:hypothetical protein